MSTFQVGQRVRVVKINKVNPEDEGIDYIVGYTGIVRSLNPDWGHGVTVRIHGSDWALDEDEIEAA